MMTLDLFYGKVKFGHLMGKAYDQTDMIYLLDALGLKQVYDNYFQTSSLKPLDQTKSNLMWSLLRKVPKFIKIALATRPRWLQ